MKIKKLSIVSIAAMLALVFSGAVSAWGTGYYGYNSPGTYGGGYRQLGFGNGIAPPGLGNPFPYQYPQANQGWYNGGTNGYYFVGKNGFFGTGPKICYAAQCNMSPLPEQCVNNAVCAGGFGQPGFWWQYFDWDANHDPNPWG